MAAIRGCRPRAAGGLHAGNAPVHVLEPTPRPQLTFTDDGPGEISSSGPRHDNDKVDYREIRILPTIDEILAIDRPIYMPKKDIRWDHPLPNGPARVLDSLFRQLRYDSIEAIRDICYSAAQTSFLNVDANGLPQALDHDHARHETLAGNRYFLYPHVQVEELLAHEAKSIVVRASYTCPAFMRGRFMYDCGRLQEGMLMALLQLDHSTRELSVYFLEVSLSQSTFSMDSFNGGGRRAAVQLAFLPTSSRDDVHQLCRLGLGLCQHTELVLVEFPKVLFAGFYNCLKRLQEMRESDFAFRRYIAPSMPQMEAWLAMEQNLAAGQPPIIDCPPPAYATAPGFNYDLSSVVSPSSRNTSMSPEDLSRDTALDVLKRDTTLDDGQAVAFRNSLMREFAFTQGPPGCGKTYLGVQLAKAILPSRPTAKPILVVCLTNHALDSFLKDLRDAGVTGLLRVGSGSKEEWTDQINLKTRKRKTRMTKDESEAMNVYATRKKETFSELDLICKGNSISSKAHTGMVPWHYVEEILFERYPKVHAQLTTNAASSLAKAFTFEYWSGGGDLKSLRDLHVELATRLNEVSLNRDKTPSEEVEAILLDITYFTERQSNSAGDSNVWTLAYGERQALLRSWEEQVDQEHFAAKLTALYLEFQDSAQEMKRVNGEREIRIMGSHDVIGMTTTACAARWEQLLSVDVEIVICEEAGEVMEAHTLCSLLPTVQHAIFIGDPLQLRPETNEQALSLETRTGSQYRLDESLLERLMLPRDPSVSAIPISQLNIQRRMHPDIANITRITYPYLRDHETTLGRPPTQGLEQRMFWWDHRIQELEADDSKSHINLHEVEMVAGLVDYLLRAGAYDHGDIAVLTPYSGQLLKLHERLSVTCDIWLSDKDRELLLDEELLALGDEGKATKDEIAMCDMLRVASVDNFQGEEAKVIILSTVRSGGSAGFLATMNRINVACSRAQNGFYIIGDSQTLSQVPMWRQVISTFSGRIGASLMTCCNVHPEHRHAVGQPSDFDAVPACSAVCGQRLDCGHECRESCHPPQLHARFVCQEPCTKVFSCGHGCSKLCYQTCGPCEQSVDEITLSCGHPGKALCSGTVAKCEVVITRKPLDCGHTLDIRCGEDPDARTFCDQPCSHILGCGHQCRGHPNRVVTLAWRDVITASHVQSRVVHHVPKVANMALAKIVVKTSVTHVSNRWPPLIADVVDRLVAKMGRKVHRYATAIDVVEQKLAGTFDSLVKDIRPNPLAAKGNIALILRRNREVLDLQKAIVSYRKEVIDRIQFNVGKQHEAFPDIVPSYVFVFHHQFDVLECRVISVRLSDTLRLASHLLGLQDPSFGVQRQALKMLEYAHKEAMGCIEFCQGALDNEVISTSPRIDAEIRLHQIHFNLVAKAIKSKLSRSGVSQDSDLSKSDDDLIEAKLKAVSDICEHYPSSLGLFMATATEFVQLLKRETGMEDNVRIPGVQTGKVREIEKTWSQFEVGHLTVCVKMHPYSAKTFSQGCPECGKRVMTGREVYQQTSAHLFEDRFLEAMRKIGKE
ncbi:hypothetical protein EDD37DRAFT_557542 [Exophiala viscosa]|uniref:uncharacterized protein n=1 Tax=Exophiala viscosa TaxID=2486360 RepID=UPI0021A1826C|nr:hypothetical protein EDD37DRAFT_557542 [Exophiala viscosa]